MINVGEEVSALKLYYDSLAWYQRIFFRLFFSTALAESLRGSPVDPLQTSLAIRDNESFFYYFFSGLSTFLRSNTFYFYTNLFDKLSSFNLATSPANFNLVLAAQDPNRVVRDLQMFNYLIVEGVFSRSEDAQQMYDFFVNNPNDIDCIAKSVVWLKKADMLTASNMDALRLDSDRRGLDSCLEILFQAGLLGGFEGQNNFNALMSSRSGLERINWAHCLKQLNIAGLLTEEVSTKNRDALSRHSSGHIYSILHILNEKNCPVSQDRFDKIIELPHITRITLVHKIDSYSQLGRDSSLIFTDQYFDATLAALSVGTRRDDKVEAYESEVEAYESEKARLGRQGIAVPGMPLERNRLFGETALRDDTSQNVVFGTTPTF